MKLTDTQLKLLSAASQRDHWIAVIPAGLTGAAARKVVDRLLANGLIEEFAASGSLPSWRADDDGTKYALRITHLGLKAIGVVPGDAEVADVARHSSEGVGLEKAGEEVRGRPDRQAEEGRRVPNAAFPSQPSAGRH